MLTVAQFMLDPSAKTADIVNGAEFLDEAFALRLNDAIVTMEQVAFSLREESMVVLTLWRTH